MLFLPERIKISGKKLQQFCWLRRGQKSELLSGEEQQSRTVWRGGGSSLDCLLMLHGSTAPVCPMSPQPRAHSHHANCLMPQPPPPICGGNICSEGNQCNILLITRRPGRDEDIIYLLFRVNWTGPCHYRLITSNDNANGIPPWGWELSQLSKMYRIWGGKSIYFLV